MSISSKLKKSIIFGLMLLLTWILINQTVEFKTDLKDRQEFGWDNWHEPRITIYNYNSTVIIDENTNISQYALSGDGLSWETAYLINSTYFLSENAQTCLILNNSHSYIIIQQSYFAFREYTHDGFNNSEIYTISLQNSSNVKFQKCEITGYWFQDNDIGLYMKNCENIIIEDSNFGTRFEQVILAELSNKILFSNIYFNYGKISSRFVYCSNVTFSNNEFIGSHTPLNNQDEYIVPGIYALEIFQCDNWTIVQNQIEYIDGGFYIDNCQNFLVQENTFHALGWAALYVWDSNGISLIKNTFAYGHVNFRTCYDVMIKENRFYGGERALTLNEIHSTEITGNRFYYMENHGISIQITNQYYEKSVQIHKNIFIECFSSIERINGENISIRYNLFLGGVQDLWFGFVFIYITYLSFRYMLHNGLLTKLSQKVKLQSLGAPSNNQKSSEVTFQQPHQASEIKNPDEIMENIRKVAVSQYSSRSFILSWVFILVVFLGLSDKRRGSMVIDFLGGLNGEPLYNVLYLDEKLFIWTNILFSIGVAIIGFKIYSKSFTILRKSVMFREISHSDSIKEFLPMGLSILGFWFSLESLVESSGNWKLILIMLIFVFTFIVIIIINNRKIKRDGKLYYGKIIPE